ncbi:hypothetical protein [Bacterioplanoides sp.]|uniref:hypothetical protein n=1 Tax=Bacterioplanoides sp. TaxID=2066072 RepID=UPI003B5BCDE8
MNVQHEGQWQDAAVFVKNSGDWVSPDVSVKHDGQWYNLGVLTLFRDMLDAEFLISKYYGYGFIHEQCGSITQNQFHNQPSGYISTLLYSREGGGTTIMIMYPEQITKACISVDGKEHTFSLSDYYGEYRGSTSKDSLHLEDNNGSTVKLIVKVK